MRFVKFEGAALHDCPDAVVVNGRRISVAEGTGVYLSSGGIVVVDIFQRPEEVFHRYRIRTIYPWRTVDNVVFTYPPVESVPTEVWGKATEQVEEEAMIRMRAKRDYPEHWMHVTAPGEKPGEKQ